MSPPPPLDPSDLLFPNAHTTLNQTLTALKRKDLSISNRLQSIVTDAKFVQEVASAYQLPLVANERCGSWYLSPQHKAGSAYFKSTDGHHGQWSFSLRRLNLQVLEVIGANGGCIILDSTRKGKSMPDALSKTIPIWIAVLNNLLFPSDADAGGLRTPDHVVSRSEHAQISTRLPHFVEEARTLRLDTDALRAKLCGKQMQPVWVTPDTDLPSSIPKSSDRSFNLVVLCTASGRTSSNSSISNYVQGAADDSESWACGLDATTFWRHKEELLSSSEEELPALIKSLMSYSRLGVQPRTPVLIKPTTGLWISNNDGASEHWQDFDFVISCSEKPDQLLIQSTKTKYTHIPCTSGKVGSRQLRSSLPKLEVLFPLLSPGSKVLVTCHTGRDLAVGVALAILCRCCDEDGTFQSEDSRSRLGLGKATIKHRLSWIMVAMPDAAPSRATLQSVNAFLLG